MKISLKLANGATLEFEGDEAEFERINAFLSAPPESLTAAPSGAGATPLQSSPEDVDPPPRLSAAALEPAAVAARLEQVGAKNDQERVTVMAQLAVESGKEGVDFATLDHLYTELAFRKPAQFPTKTLSNAKASGLVRLVKPGIWRPTFRGENFARGLGRGDREPRRSPQRPGTSTSNGGGETD
jgi:hypothetical protein